MITILLTTSCHWNVFVKINKVYCNYRLGESEKIISWLVCYTLSRASFCLLSWSLVSSVEPKSNDFAIHMAAQELCYEV